MIKKLLILVFFLGPSIGLAQHNHVAIAGVPHPPESKFVEVYAHRGLRSFAPENTLPGYQAGLAVGTHWVDMDIGITKDGIIVVYHDIWLNPDLLKKDGKFWANSKQDFMARLEGLAGGIDKNIQPYLVKNHTLAELRKYDAGTLNPKSPYSKYFPGQHPVAGAIIPTLQEVIEYVKSQTKNQVNFQIEVKNDPEKPGWTVSALEFAQKINNIVNENKITNQVEIQSFDWNVLYHIRNINPDIKLAFLVSGESMELMKSSDVKKAGSWTGGRLLKDYGGSVPRMIKELGGCCYEPDDVSLTKEDLDEAHRLGLKVVVWTWPENSGSAFDPAMVDKLIRWGVDGIITDDAGQLNSMLAARGLPVPRNYPVK